MHKTWIFAVDDEDPRGSNRRDSQDEIVMFDPSIEQNPSPAAGSDPAQLLVDQKHQNETTSTLSRCWNLLLKSLD